MGLEQGKPSINELKPQLKIAKFEPFGAPEGEKRETLFVNNYNGHYSQHMELNRRAVERVLKLAHLDGPVTLDSMPYSRARSLDANSDGSVSAKRSLFFGEKIERAEENPHMKIVSLPIGWKIEINDQRLMENLTEKRLEPRKRQKEFISMFNEHLIRGLMSCILKEKLSDAKDKYFDSKRFWSIAYPIFNSILALMPPRSLRSSLIQLAVLLLTYSLNNALDTATAKRMKEIEEIFKMHGKDIGRSSGFKARKIDHLWEYALPLVEIDKVIESFIYLSTAGQTLVREKKSFDKSISNPLK